jgi:hypothetical protein
MRLFRRPAIRDFWSWSWSWSWRGDTPKSSLAFRVLTPNAEPGEKRKYRLSESNPDRVRCDSCGSEWSVARRIAGAAAGRRVAGWWKCPNRCNWPQRERLWAEDPVAYFVDETMRIAKEIETRRSVSQHELLTALAPDVGYLVGFEAGKANDPLALRRFIGTFRMGYRDGRGF